MIELLLQAERALSVGLLDRAETLYRQVAKADPKNSIAVVGLARVTLDRGDDVGALTLARKALAIDPENPAAERMVLRLEEILEYRDATALMEEAVAVEAEVAVTEEPPIEAPTSEAEAETEADPAGEETAADEPSAPEAETTPESLGDEVAAAEREPKTDD
ncbi:MAG: tetratricopeptide repeat protein, partial [Chloroflexota bacterium]